MGSPSLTPAGTPGASSPRLSVRRSLSGLTRLFSAGASASEVDGPGNGAAAGAAPPVSRPVDDGSLLSAGGLQPSLMASDATLASGSSSGRQTPSGEPWLVMLPRPQTNQPTRQGVVRSGGSGGSKPAAASAGSPSGSSQILNVKKIRMAGKLLEELETEALSANGSDEADQDYIGTDACLAWGGARGTGRQPLTRASRPQSFIQHTCSRSP